MLDQFKNPENAMAHELTTGPELIECIESTVGGSRPTSGKIDAFFAGAGSGGTLAGVSRAIKKSHNPDVQIIACDPVGAYFHEYSVVLSEPFDCYADRKCHR